MNSDEYKTIESPSEGQFKEKGSKFLAFAFPVSTEEEMELRRAEIRKKYHDARHHVYAFRIGADLDFFRASDDGEPSNSSGPPVLGQIKSFELTDIVIIVVRYFGGTKLGVPGLINAYKTAAYEALSQAKIITCTVTNEIVLKFDYQYINDVMRIIKEENINPKEQKFEMSCQIVLEVALSETERIRERFKKLYEIEVSD